jgi:ABC-2 type transport system ATP-binding protein
MKSLLNRLDKEAFIFDLKNPLPHDVQLDELNYHRLDDTTIEIEISREASLNDVFTLLNQHNIEVLSMKNKVNRLEELFLNLVEKTEVSA